MEVKLDDKLAYIIAVVNDFVAKFALNSQQAYRYLIPNFLKFSCKIIREIEIERYYVNAKD